ncbi:hypothetical protein CJ739_3907 [Mariniflexile rhizosphaerae]|uniref:DUF2911 domain-containing protein n=1 Tax=unclassified Mariniflexile TaxID=2643887 RepID=UPI000CAA9A47|nr:DUF2911 domain-containing protein [Mariniflexile sp. TRM1-10]AXP82966.1 hypothetical protein CJ739_3907 [Mariniflexile sp. TRM1-10]PLB19638.1 MAG: DUF2911 domain containing protein [Flavobacteriaceae bacterium FS1-H7996/R]
MKKLLLILLAITAAFSVNAQITTPQPSPFSKLEQKVGLTDITLEYSRPSMRGRVIFGGLEPYGELWRLGANANTKITFSTDVTIGGNEVKAGTYAIFATPNETSWNVVFYNDASNWGTPQKWDDSKVVAMVTAEVYPMPVKIETFTMTFDDLTNSSAVLGMLWESVYVGVKIEVPTDEMVMASINEAMNGTPAANDYFAAAVYYLQEGKDINQAKTWIDKAISMAGDKAPFWQLRQQSLIYAKSGDKKGAIAAAKKSLAAAEAEGNADYVKMNKDSLKEWGAK